MLKVHSRPLLSRKWRQTSSFSGVPLFPVYLLLFLGQPGFFSTFSISHDPAAAAGRVGARDFHSVMLGDLIEHISLAD